MGSGKLVKQAIKKYGVENFQKEILFVFDTKEEMDAKEKELVVISEQSYNLMEGGHGGFDYIHKNGMTNKSLGGKRARQITDKILEEKHGKDWRLKIINVNKMHSALRHKYPNGSFGFLGKKHKPETKIKIGKSVSVRQAGKNNSQYGTLWINNGVEVRKIKTDDFPLWMKIGYSKGRKL